MSSMLALIPSDGREKTEIKRGRDWDCLMRDRGDMRIVIKREETTCIIAASPLLCDI